MRLRGLVSAAILLLLATSSWAQGHSSGPAKTLLNQERYIPDITTFLQIGGNTASAYSWDSSTVFFQSGASGATQLYRLLPEGWPYQLTAFEDGIDFFSLSWGGTMGIVGASVGGSEQSQLFLIDTRTGQIYQLTDSHNIRYDGVVWAKDDASILYSSNEENKRDFNIFRMSVITGESKKIFGNDSVLAGSKWIADVSQDGSKMIVIRFHSNVKTDLFLVDINTGGWQMLNDPAGDVYYTDATLMPDNKTIWLLCNGNDDGVIRLARMQVGSKKVEFVNDGWIDPRWDIEGLSFSRDYKYMRALVNEEGYMRMQIREVESRRELPSPPLDGQLSGGSFAKDGTMLISFHGPTRAPDVWKWDPNTETLTQLTFATYAGIDRALFSDPKLVHYTSFDGLEIPAFLYLPPDYKEGTPIPFIVDAHGGPEGQFTPDFVRNIQYLILNGYGVLAPNPRGSSGYGREYLNLDNYKLRQNSLKDYKAGADWLVANGYSQAGMMGIRGGSYGGYVVLGMITEYPELFSAAVDDVGIANFKTFLENTADYRRALREAEYGPLSDPEFLDSISPIFKANLIRTPLLVVHGENDPRVPVGEARQIIKAIQDNHGVVDSLIFANEGHGTGKRANTVVEYRKQVEFFNTYLKSNVIEPTVKPEN